MKRLAEWALIALTAVASLPLLVALLVLAACGVLAMVGGCLARMTYDLVRTRCWPRLPGNGLL